MNRIKNKSDIIDIAANVHSKNSPKQHMSITKSILAKVTAFILVIIMSVITVACVVGTVVMSVYEMYTTPQNAFLEEICQEIAESDCENILGYIAINKKDQAERYCSERNITSISFIRNDNKTVLWKWNSEKGKYLGNGASFSYEWKFGEDFKYENFQEVYVEVIVDIDTAVNDNYTMAFKLIDFTYSMLYWVYIIGIVAFIIAVACFIFLMCASGHRKGYDEVREGWGTKIPFDLLTGVLIFLVFIILWLMFELPYEITGIIFALFVMFVMLESAVIGWFMSLALRVKLGKWWKNTIIYRLLVVMWRIVKFLGIKVKMIFKLAVKLICNIPIVWKTVLIIIVVRCAELFFMILSWNVYGSLITLWFFSSIVLGIAVLYCAIVLKQLQKGGETLANGDLSYQIDTSKMFWDFKKHGESLNSIAKGMTLAVEQRMKSERMKTELITNVSHDIKTPLTSIINYTDLISKEYCSNDKIIEYSSVLLRQSKRLKRLIDDLVEASKASTGNLEVILTPCEANILLTQVVGEYDEKLKSKNLELITTQPSESIMIMADGRRLWRVFDNLINNICKYAQSSTRVYLSLEKKQEKAVITFKNTSHSPLNISADELMERFVRGDSSRNTEGNGLGLSIAKSLTELQKGSLELSIDGDLFKVTLKFPTIK